MNEVDKQIEKVLATAEVYGECMQAFGDYKSRANAVDAYKAYKVLEAELRTLLSTSQDRITSLEALLKFADARINLMVEKAEGAKGVEQAPDVYSIKRETLDDILSDAESVHDKGEYKSAEIVSYMRHCLKEHESRPAPALEVERAPCGFLQHDENGAFVMFMKPAHAQKYRAAIESIGDRLDPVFTRPQPVLNGVNLTTMGYAAEINGVHFCRFDDWLPDDDCYDHGTLVELYALPISEEEAEARRTALAASQPNGEAVNG